DDRTESRAPLIRRDVRLGEATPGQGDDVAIPTFAAVSEFRLRSHLILATFPRPAVQKLRVRRVNHGGPNIFHAQQCQSPASAKAYLVRDEPGIHRSYGGKGFDRLGLDPRKVDQRTFNKLIDGINPVTGRHLTPRKVKDAISGWYLTFS